MAELKIDSLTVTLYRGERPLSVTLDGIVLRPGDAVELIDDDGERWALRAEVHPPPDVKALFSQYRAAKKAKKRDKAGGVRACLKMLGWKVVNWPARNDLVRE